MYRASPGCPLAFARHCLTFTRDVTFEQVRPAVCALQPRSKANFRRNHLVTATAYGRVREVVKKRNKTRQILTSPSAAGRRPPRVFL